MYIALDIETTGLNKNKDEIIELAAVKFDDEKIIDQFTTLINPGINLPKVITRLTGITDEELKNAPVFTEVKNQFAEFIGDAKIIGHFISFDIDFLKAKGLILENTLLDTLTLAQVLLPKEPSYSLEILSDKFNLPHQHKHRALDDALVGVHLYRFLQNLIQKIDPQILSEIQPYLQKSAWPWKDEFTKKHSALNNLPEKSALITDIPLIKEQSSLSTLFEKLPEILNNENSYLIEAETYSPADYLKNLISFAKTNSKKIIISGSITPTIIDQYPDKITILSSPDQYLCSEFFTQFLQKISFTDPETTFLLKILLWLPNTKTGLKTELALTPEEHRCFEEVCSLENSCQKHSKNNCYFKKALTELTKNSICFCNHHSLLKNINLLPAFNPDLLFLDNIENLERAAEQTFTSHFSLARFEALLHRISSSLLSAENQAPLLSRLTILFGLFGIFFEKNLNQSADTYGLNLNHFLASAIEWKNILNAAKNINDLADELPLPEGSPNNDQIALLELQKELKKFIHLLKSHNNTLLTLYRSPQNVITIKAAPVFLAPLLETALFPLFPKIIGLSASIKTSYLQNGLGLPKKMLELSFPSKIKKKIPFTLLSDSAEPKSEESFNHSILALQQIIKDHQGKTFILSSSVDASLTLAEKLHDSLPADLKILAQKENGLGKTVERYRKNPEQSILIGNHYFLENTLKFAKDCSPETLVITRLPFDSPYDELLKLRQQPLRNSFMEFILPRSIMKLKKIINSFVLNGGKKIYCLDIRLSSPNFGPDILASLPKYLEINTN